MRAPRLLQLMLLREVMCAGAQPANMSPVSFSSKLQARRVALEWYCIENKADHKGEVPCLNHQFTLQMAQATSDEERKSIMLQRSSWIAQQEKKGRREPAALKQAYVAMYRAFCAAKAADRQEVCVEEAIRGKRPALR